MLMWIADEWNVALCFKKKWKWLRRYFEENRLKLKGVGDMDLLLFVKLRRRTKMKKMPFFNWKGVANLKLKRCCYVEIETVLLSWKLKLLLC